MEVVVVVVLGSSELQRPVVDLVIFEFLPKVSTPS